MSRKKRQLRKRFVIYCEGNTEYNYIDSMRKNQGVELSLVPVNMKGGGYSHFLDVIKTSPLNNCLAKFIMIDADLIAQDSIEREHFVELLDYCKRQNRLQTIPHFIIANQPNFDYVTCLHDPSYHGQNLEQFITNIWKYEDVTKYKSDNRIYEYLNSQQRSYQCMLEALPSNNKLVSNTYKVNRNHFEIEVTKTLYNPENAAKRGSNIEEFFDIIDW